MGSESSFVEFVCDQLGDLPGIGKRAMFGGHGLYLEDVFVGIVYEDRLYLKTDDVSRRWYEEQGMECFKPNATQTLKSFYEVPAHVIEDPAQLEERFVEAGSL